MDAVISALEHTLSRRSEPELRQQLMETIERLQKERGEHSARVSTKRPVLSRCPGPQWWLRLSSSKGSICARDRASRRQRFNLCDGFRGPVELS
jgi:hypothetical protein